MRVVRQIVYEEFFTRRLPEDGFTLDERHDQYFGLIRETKPESPELHGFVIGLSGEVIVPQLRPESSAVAGKPTHA